MDFEAGRCDVAIHYAKISGKEYSRFYRRNVAFEVGRQEITVRRLMQFFGF